METIKLSGYRWVVLSALMMIGLMVQVQWLTHAPIARAAEVSSHAPESTSKELLLLVGQVSGIIMVTGMSMRNKVFLSGFLMSFIGLAVIAAIVTFTIKESALIIAERKKERNEVKNQSEVGSRKSEVRSKKINFGLRSSDFGLISVMR
jgi:hypothetical protein